MALDEFCLENIVLDEPYFYLWRNRPSVIIGLNQNAYSEVNLKYLEENGINLVRRVTGGGAVYHDLQNLNYTIVGWPAANDTAAPCASHPIRANGRGSVLPPAATGPAVIVNALRELGVPAELTGRNDIFVEGRKVSGYARRVSKQQEIIHGTSRVANLKDYLPGFKSLDEVQAALQDILANGDHQMELTESQLNEVRIMAETKFSTWDFIYGRSRQADLVRKAKLPCGTVEAAISLDRGLITRISFSGDFMFDEPPTELESELTGCRFERAAIVELSSSLSIPKHFKGATINDFLGLLFE